jgi:hypothetical protein
MRVLKIITESLRPGYRKQNPPSLGFCGAGNAGLTERGGFYLLGIFVRKRGETGEIDRRREIERERERET